jgi:1-acyl-sn-glycerol-3-phosphate acyltransferase
MHALKSLWIWCTIALLILLWLPFLAVIRLTDRDPVHYRTGRWFRRLGVAMTKVNPLWRLEVTGETISHPRNPYVVVSNHQSLGDIPLISHLPWEMKWVGKEELFRLPVVGWMMRMAGDIAVNRADARSGARTIIQATRVLEQHCSVMFFPEGTRSLDGRVGRFNDGAFHLALRARVPVLPVAVEGSRDCLPKRSWVFGSPNTIRVKVLPPIDPAALALTEAPALRDAVRAAIIRQIADWRGVPVGDVDALSPR